MQAPHEFGVEIDRGPETVVVRISGDLDMANAVQLTEALTTAGDGTSSLVADLAAVTFIDSSALSAIVAAARTLADRGTRLTLGNRSSVADRVLEVAGLGAGTDDFDVRPLTDLGTPDG
jgi:anti-anti-sigma factor